MTALQLFALLVYNLNIRSLDFHAFAFEDFWSWDKCRGTKIFESVLSPGGSDDGSPKLLILIRDPKHLIYK